MTNTFNKWCGVNVYAPVKFICWNLTPNVMLGGPGQEGGATERSLAPSDMAGSLQPGFEPLLDSKSASYDLGLPRLQNDEK